MSEAYEYVGDELHLFAGATNWKSYLREVIRPHLHGDVLEVGAGIGGTTRMLYSDEKRRWVCLEPDPELAGRCEIAVSGLSKKNPVEVRVGSVADLGSNESFDSIVYVDVLEHIEDDRAELERATRLLRPAGRILVMSPAHQFLYTPFDKAIGHFRRYDRASLARLEPAGLTLQRAMYLDSVGMAASLLNRILLRQSMPTTMQLAIWDKGMVPISRRIDAWLGNRLGKSILAIWKKA